MTDIRNNLAIPFFLKNKLREQYPKLRWDAEKKTWYFIGELPDGLKKYIETPIDIKYEERDEYKAQFTSLKWNKEIKSWICSADDFEKIEKYREEKE